MADGSAHVGVDGTHVLIGGNGMTKGKMASICGDTAMESGLDSMAGDGGLLTRVENTRILLVGINGVLLTYTNGNTHAVDDSESVGRGSLAIP